MIKSIFDIENRLDIQKEFRKMVEVLHKTYDSIYTYEEGHTSFIHYVNREIFKNWPYRDTFLTVEEYIEHLGITKEVLQFESKITEEVFLYYIQFILNMTSNYSYHPYEETEMLKALMNNIPLILEKMNYKPKYVDEKVLIVKRDADVDSILDKVSLPIAERLLEYNDFRIKNNMQEKKEILKAIDLYIEQNKKELSGIDNKLYNAIGTIVNEMGVNHPINKKFEYLTEKELLEWYDKCFLMMIHLIRGLEINKIKRERENLINNNQNSN